MVEFNSQHFLKKSKIRIVVCSLLPHASQFSRVTQLLNLFIHLHSPEASKCRTEKTIFGFFTQRKTIVTIQFNE